MTKAPTIAAPGGCIADLAKISLDNPTSIVVLDCDLQGSVKTGDFASVSPDRFIEVGIMEHHTAVLGGALSSCGIQTFWADFGMFGLDEVYNMHRLNDINHTNLKVALTHVGLDVGEDGKTHQCIDYIGLLRNLYGFRLICPADPNQTDRVVRWLIDKPGNYIITRAAPNCPSSAMKQPALAYGPGYGFEYGRADILRSGKDATLFVTAPAANAVGASTSCAEGISCRWCAFPARLRLDAEALGQAAGKA